MSKKEINRLEIIQQLEQRQLNQREAAKRLSITTRQVRRLQAKYRRVGPQGLLSERRGRPSNNRLSSQLKQTVIAIVKANYPDFNPTFAHEKLVECHGIEKPSVETLRKWMIEAGLWHGKKRRVARIHQSRQPRACLGELVQIDGSPHAWFEDRGPACCLLVFVDDATSKIMQLHFEPQESTQGYFDAIHGYVLQHGKPACFYSDRHSIFRVNIKEAEQGTGETQLGRALKTLGIRLICANSPQAKGRVENKNGVLQNRLVKELRLRGISDIETANAYLPAFIEDFNQRFAKAAANPTDKHTPCLLDEGNLRGVLSHQETRTITKNLEVHYRGSIYQIQTSNPSYTMRGAKLTVIDDRGQVTLRYKGKSLLYKVLEKQKRYTVIANSKELDSLVDQAVKQGSCPKPPKPRKDHPWRRGMLLKHPTIPTYAP